MNLLLILLTIAWSPSPLMITRSPARVKINMSNKRPVCVSSDECPKDKYCCQIVPNVLNLCCGDPLRSVENFAGISSASVPIPVPVQREYDY